MEREITGGSQRKGGREKGRKARRKEREQNGRYEWNKQQEEGERGGKGEK